MRFPAYFLGELQSGVPKRMALKAVGQRISNQMNAKGPDKASTEEVSGLIERVTFHNEENGFCVLRVKVRGHRDKVTGTWVAAFRNRWGSGWRPRAGGLETKSTGSNSRPD